MDLFIPESLADAVAAGLALHRGSSLNQAAREVLSQLPDGQVTLVATSLEGAGLAAACAAVASDRVISWQLVNPCWQYEIDGLIVGIAPCDPGDGWKRVLCDRFSGIRFVFPQSVPRNGQINSISSQLLPVPPPLPGLAPNLQAAESLPQSS
jgi:hypothetical protein